MPEPEKKPKIPRKPYKINTNKKYCYACKYWIINDQVEKHNKTNTHNNKRLKQKFEMLFMS
jgi:hypothetical protein